MICHVLIVDDSPVLRAAIAKVVRLAGIPEECISMAGNGSEALAVLESRTIDLVLLDLNMPYMDGEEFTRRLRRHPKLAATRIVIVSTETNHDRMDRLKALGVTHSLRKPFQPEDLCRLLQKVLGGPACAN